jgi:dihydropteroate synthase
MGIVNLSPDSFSEDGHTDNLSAQCKHCEQLIEQGADILDIGGESTRPGSRLVSVDEELKRVLPLVRIAVQMNVPISVDTNKPEVMTAVLDAGADIINDIWALRQNNSLDVVANHPTCGVCLMHMHGAPLTMQVQPMSSDADAVGSVRAFLHERSKALLERGIEHSRITLDPGIGFGKTVKQNFELLARQSELLELGFPLLAGWSRKSALGAALIDKHGHAPPPAQRVSASVAAALLCVERGARIVRVHDVAATVQAIKIWKFLDQVATLK